ncbi:GFA family protein [Allosphingosinicella flava]|uniref:GFA family protein n=1 Tax=Allosphingosinicella flava TaxID=2771430 RepID=A0A7T2GLX7_9SPHN|nr:GFA family protein [Sphingosinicella flava]QPQ56232.1 GFA family protein [Sphingosinicella flava]
MVTEMTGGCTCGKIRYSADIANDEAYLCHCRMCQRASGNVSLAMKNVKKADVRWEGEPDYYQSSPIARRGFCSTCGTSLTFEFPDSANMDLTVASFDDPSRFRPVHHFGAESIHRAWLNTQGLKEIRTEEHQGLVDRWMKTVGKLPD